MGLALDLFECWLPECELTQNNLRIIHKINQSQSVVGVAGGCTRATIKQHQALCNNTADVSAKDGSQVLFTFLMR